MTLSVPGKTAGLIAAAALVWLSGCAPTAEPPADTPSATPSVAVTATPSAPVDPFPNAVRFTNAIYRLKYDEAAALTADGSPAARFVEHQQNLLATFKSNKIKFTITKFDVVDDPAAKTVTATALIKGKPKGAVYLHKDWTYDAAGKIISWSSRAGLLDGRVLSKQSRGTTKAIGLSGSVTSAFKSDDTSLYVELDVTVAKPATLVGLDYFNKSAPGKGIAAPSGAPVTFKKGVSKAYYVFGKKAKVGGTIRLVVESGGKRGELRLKVE